MLILCTWRSLWQIWTTLFQNPQCLFILKQLNIKTLTLDPGWSIRALWSTELALKILLLCQWLGLFGMTFSCTKHSQQKLTDNMKKMKSNKLWALMVDFLQNCLQVEDVTLMGLEKGKVVWNGRVCEMLTDAECEEILWELSELNFRFEILALDSWVTTNTDADQWELISACFPGCTLCSLLVADLGMVNHGLADGNWENRATFLHALKRIMMGWRGNVPPIIQVQKFKWIRQDMQELENAITSFYVQSFYNYFQRLPIVPHGLSHTASLYIPKPPRVTILDPHPEVFYDVNILLPL